MYVLLIVFCPQPIPPPSSPEVKNLKITQHETIKEEFLKVKKYPTWQFLRISVNIIHTNILLNKMAATVPGCPPAQ